MSNDIKLIFEKYLEVLNEADFSEPRNPRDVFNRFVDRGNYGGSGGKRFGGGVSLAGQGLGKKNLTDDMKEKQLDDQKRQEKKDISLSSGFFTDLKQLADESPQKYIENFIAFFEELDSIQGQHVLRHEDKYIVFDFELSNRIANLSEMEQNLLRDPLAIPAARYLKNKLIERMLDIPAWYFRLKESGLDIPEGRPSGILLLRIDHWCKKPENKHYNLPIEVFDDGTIRRKVSNVDYKSHEGGEKIQADIMPSGDSKSEMRDFEKRGIETDAPILGNPDTPYLPQRRTPENITSNIGEPERETVDEFTPKPIKKYKKKPAKPVEEPKITTPPSDVVKKKKPAAKKPAAKKPKAEKPEVKKESVQRFIKLIPF
jgi:hypothetical protein